MVPITIAGIMLAFLLVDVALQFIGHMRGKRVHGFFIPDPVEEKPDFSVRHQRVVDCLKDFGILPAPHTFLHAGHTWAAMEESGEASVGMDALVQRAIGKFDVIMPPQVGQQVRQGEKLFAIRQGKRTADFVAPIDGTVTSVKDGGGERGLSGWICKMKPSNLASNLGKLKIAEDAISWTYDELYRLHELVVTQIPRLEAVGVTMQDGALALDNLLGSLDDDAWNLFNERFLNGVSQ